MVRRRGLYWGGLDRVGVLSRGAYGNRVGIRTRDRGTDSRGRCWEYGSGIR